MYTLLPQPEGSVSTWRNICQVESGEMWVTVSGMLGFVVVGSFLIIEEEYYKNRWTQNCPDEVMFRSELFGPK